LLVGLQLAGVLGLCAHALDGVHHIALLSQEGISEIAQLLVNAAGSGLKPAQPGTLVLTVTHT
jgi:hypothetical protein